jgi:hypothetical protein
MKDLAKAREILEGDRELAKRFGYTPQSQRPQVIVSMRTPKARIDELIAAGYNPVTDDRLARSLGELPDVPRIETDPITGRQEFKGSFHPQAALSISGGSSLGTPPTLLEYTRNSWIGMRMPVDRFSLNPAADYYIEIREPAPQMFAGGTRDLPVITGSGVDPSVLRWVAWGLRHSAAFTSSRADVAIMVELSMAGDPESWQNDQDLQNEAGRQSLNDYWGRVVTWVSTLPTDAEGLPQDLTPEEIARLYPDGNQ